MQKIIINATLTTVQPVSIRLPDQPGHPTMTRRLLADSQASRTAYIPATTFRGKIRRLAVLPLMQEAQKKGEPWTLNHVYESMLGQDAESESSEVIDLVALKARREGNHIVDLFGAGLGVKSRLSVGHFLPADNILPETFRAVRKDLDSDPDVLDLMSPVEVKKFTERNTTNSKRSEADALVKKTQAQIRKADKAGQDASDLRAALVIAESERDQYLESMGTMKNSTKTLIGYEALPAGIELTSRLVIDRATTKDFTMMIDAFDLFSRSPVLGGQSARGCGEVAGKFDFLDQEGTLLMVMTAGDYMPGKVNWTPAGTRWIAGI